MSSYVFEGISYMIQNTGRHLNSLRNYKGCSEGNASYFILSVHNNRGGCWCYSRRGWTFTPILHNILFFVTDGSRGAVWQKWHLLFKCLWSKDTSLNSSMWENMAPIDIHWHVLNVYRDQTVDVSTVRQWMVCFSSGDSSVKDKPRSRWPYRFLQVWHTDSYSSLRKMHSWWW